MSKRMPEDNVRKNVRKICQKECQKDMSERRSEDMSANQVRRCARKNVKRYVPKNVGRYARRYSRKNVKRYVRKNVRRYVRKNVRRYVRRNVRKICQKICPKSCQKKGQKECQKICQKECQKICQKDVRKNVRRYVRKNVKRYVRKNGKRYVRKNVRRYKDSCLHLVVSILLIASYFFALFGALQRRTAASTVGLNFVFVQGSEFGLAAMAEVVVERPETIFIGTANQVAKGVEHVWRYKLTPVGAERMYVCMEPPSTTHAGDLMFIMGRSRGGNKWYVAYEGRPVPNAEGEQELEKRAAVFRTSASFWRMECTSGRQMMCGAEPPTQKKWKNHSGKRLASWFAHAMRCSRGTLNPLPVWTQLLFGGAVWCMWCVCVCWTTGVLHLWT